MSELDALIWTFDAQRPMLAGLAVGGWLAALLTALAAVAQAGRADRMAQRAAEAAHELRGPLCAARLALDGFERTFAEAPRALRVSAAVDLELRRAGLALEDLTSLTTRAALAGRRTSDAREAIDVPALVLAAEPTWRAIAESHGTTLAVRIEARVGLLPGDPRRLAQALGNLVANACEHGRGPVTVAVGGDSGGVRIAVSDHGAGPAPAVVRAARRRSRKPWFRTGRPSQRGHGMAVAARAASALGGSLRAQKTPEGTCVAIELPVDEPRRRRLAVVARGWARSAAGGAAPPPAAAARAAALHASARAR